MLPNRAKHLIFRNILFSNVPKLIAVCCDVHFMKSVQIRSFFWSLFSRIWIEHGGLLRKSPCSVRIRENTDQKNSEYGHILRSTRARLIPFSNRLAGWRPKLQQYETETPVQMFPCKFSEIFRNKCFVEHLQTGASKISHYTVWKTAWQMLFEFLIFLIYFFAFMNI